MTTLTLRLAGPLQSWGVGGRWDERPTSDAPTKSGVVGLLAAAAGVRRGDPIEHLAGLRFGVRLDQPGRIERDYQTATETMVFGEKSKPRTAVSERFYLADAAFLAAVEGDHDMLAGLAENLANPTFPLYLGRRACPPAGPLRATLHNEPLETVLTTHPWVAAPAEQAKHPEGRNVLVLRDANPGEGASFEVSDVPISFGQSLRKYHARRVVSTTTRVYPTTTTTGTRKGTKPSLPAPTLPADELDPFLAFGD